MIIKSWTYQEDERKPYQYMDSTRVQGKVRFTKYVEEANGDE